MAARRAPSTTSPAVEAVGEGARAQRHKERQGEGERETPAARRPEGRGAGDVEVHPVEQRGPPGTLGDLDRGGEREEVGEDGQEKGDQHPFTRDQWTRPSTAALEGYGRQRERRQDVHRQREIVDAEEAHRAHPDDEATGGGGDGDQDEAKARARGEGALRPADPSGRPGGGGGGERPQGDRGQAEGDEAGEEAALGAGEVEEALAVGGVEDTRVEERQEIHAEPLGLTDVALEAEFATVDEVGPQEGGEGGGEQGEGEGAAEQEAASQRGGAEEEKRGHEARQEEGQTEDLVETRESLGPEGGHQQGEVAPARALQEDAVEGPQDEGRQGRHLVGELAEVVHAVREEGVDQSGEEARKHAAREGVGEQIHESTARHQGREDEHIDEEQRGGAERQEGGSQETREEL